MFIIHNLYKEKNVVKNINPYTRNPFPKDLKDNLRQIIRLSRYFTPRRI